MKIFTFMLICLFVGSASANDKRVMSPDATEMLEAAMNCPRLFAQAKENNWQLGSVEVTRAELEDYAWVSNYRIPTFTGGRYPRIPPGPGPVLAIKRIVTPLRGGDVPPQVDWSCQVHLPE